MGRPYLGEFEELVLLTVAVLEGGAYGVSIASELRDRTTRSFSLSSVHIALYRLEEKGYAYFLSRRQIAYLCNPQSGSCLNAIVVAKKHASLESSKLLGQ